MDTKELILKSVAEALKSRARRQAAYLPSLEKYEAAEHEASPKRGTFCPKCLARRARVAMTAPTLINPAVCEHSDAELHCGGLVYCPSCHSCLNLARPQVPHELIPVA